MRPSPIQFCLHLLSHPLSLLAWTIWLANDLILKPLHPSFWTGKLGDLAGLFVLPFLAGFFLSTLERPFKFSPKTLLVLSLTIPGGLFTLVKSVPGFTIFLNHLLATRITQDFSDLIALPVLAGSALLWRSLYRSPSPQRNGLRWLALPFALLVTMADMAAPDYGIKCVQQTHGTLRVASMTSQHYVSADGGLTWQTDASETSFTCDYSLESLPALLDDPTRGLQYRIPARSQVEVSADGGHSWTTETIDTSLSDAEWAYIRITRSWNPMLEEGILNAMVDPTTGNLVLAMGQQGVLVRSPSGTYTWVDIGPYQHRGLEKAGVTGFFTLLLMPLLFCLLAGLLAMRTWAHKYASSPWQVILTILAWLLTFIAGIMAFPALIYNQSFMNQINLIVYPVSFIFLVVLLALSADRLKGSVQSWIRQVPFALGISLAAFLFYVAWYLNWIKTYEAAAFLSGTVLVVAIIVHNTRIRNPQQPPPS